MSELLTILKKNNTVKSREDAKKLYEESSLEYRKHVKENDFINFMLSPSKESFLWFDYEAGGVNAKCAPPLQCAMIRTDLDMNIIDSPINLYCMLHGDKLPHPEAIKITKINPMHCIERGEKEPDFFRVIASQMTFPNTCNAGYNSLSYDDEMTRFGFFRSLIPVYDREWKNGCSRWDLYPVTSAFFAKFRDEINWPTVDGVTSLKLENIAKANNITQDSAHNAVDDVMALISLARLLKATCKKTWQYLYDGRKKQTNANLISTGACGYILHKNIGVESNFKAPVVILGEVPEQKGSFICVNLEKIESIREIYHLSKEDIKHILFMKKDELEMLLKKRPAIYRLQTNKQPQFFPIGHPILTGFENFDVGLIGISKRLCAQKEFVNRIVHAFRYEEKEDSQDVEMQPYSAGFPSSGDQIKLSETSKLRGEALKELSVIFDGAHYNTLRDRLVSKMNDDLEWSKACKNALLGHPSTECQKEINWGNVVELLEKAELPEPLKKGYLSMLKIFAARAKINLPTGF